MLRPLLLPLLTSGLLHEPARAQSPASSVEDRVQIPWQRSLDDAEAMVARTGKPLLLCVNMDGEPASEILAHRRYRDPAFVELIRGFVPVILSPNLRRTRDHDDRGRRIPDPRFGRIVNQEAIEDEPRAFVRYFDGHRVAPRHVGVAPDGTVLFDLYLLNDLSAIDAALAEHGRTDLPMPDPQSATEEALLESPDAGCRDELEQRFLAGSVRTRVRLAGLCLSRVREVQHVEVLRLALRDPDPQVRRQAAWSMAQHPHTVPVPFFRDAFHVAFGLRAESTALLSALDEIAADRADPVRALDAARYARVYRGMGSKSEFLDEERWRLALGLAVRPAEPRALREADDLDAVAEAFEIWIDEIEAAVRRSPADVSLRAQLAHARLRYAVQVADSGGNALYHLERVLEAVDETLAIEAQQPIALACRASALHRLGDLVDDDLLATAEAAGAALRHLLPHATSELAAEALWALGRSRVLSVYEAMNTRRDYPQEWLADARAALLALCEHPAVAPHQIHFTVDALGRFGATTLQEAALKQEIERAPLDGTLHHALRVQLLRDYGPEELERFYTDEYLPRVGETGRPSAWWYFGLATLYAAERHVFDAAPESAHDAYLRCIERFERAKDAEPEFAGWSDHYQSLALHGLAVIALESRELDNALAAFRRAVAHSPASVETRDGLDRSMRETEQQLAEALERAGRTEEAAELSDWIRAQIDEDRRA